MPADDNTIIVSHVGKDLQVPPKVASILGEYKRTEPGCFRKEVSGKQVGGKLEFKDGYWYFKSNVGEKLAWAEGVVAKVPEAAWKSNGEGRFFSSQEDAQISVKPKPGMAAKLKSDGVGCSEFCSKKFQEVKAQLPDHHKKKIEDAQAKANEHVEKVKAKANEHIPVLKAQASQRLETAKGVVNEYHPVVKQKAKEGYTACFDFWTHPDTVNTMKTGAASTGEGLKFCAAGCLSICAHGLDLIAGKEKPAQETPATQVPGALQDKEKEEFVMLEPTNVVPEPVLPPEPPTTTQ
jgi:hypothetical protein